MGNYENIREYTEFSHEAASHGGPKRYIEEYGNARYECGREEQKEEDQFKIMLAVVGTTIVCAFIGWGKQKVNEFKRKKVQERAEQAKESCIKAIEEKDTQTEPDDVNSNKIKG